jgi:hypothetical protein
MERGWMSILFDALWENLTRVSLAYRAATNAIHEVIDLV